MPVSSDSRQLNYWETLRRIQKTVKKSDPEFAAMLGMNSKRFTWYASRRRDLPASAIIELTQRLPVSFERVFLGTVDFNALAAHVNQKNASYIPERYRLAAFSKRRTSLNALYFIDKHYGKDLKRIVLSHLQVDEGVFNDPEASINIFFINDLLNYLTRYGHTAGHFVQIGKYSTDTNRLGPIGSALKECATPRTMYDKIVNELSTRFDENFDYRIVSLSDKSVVIQARQREQTEDGLKMKIYGSEPICWMRIGLCAAVPRYQGLPEASFRKTKCVHSGDECCEMELDFEFATFAAKRLRR